MRESVSARSCEVVGARYPTIPLGLITVAGMLPPHWDIRLVNCNTEDLLDEAVGSDIVPGAAALVACGDEIEIASAGEVKPDSIVRIASTTKPIVAAAVMLMTDSSNWRSGS